MIINYPGADCWAVRTRTDEPRGILTLRYRKSLIPRQTSPGLTAGRFVLEPMSPEVFWRVNKKVRFYITGLSGTGKTTIIKELAERGMAAFDVDEVAGLCRWRNKKTFERVDYHSGVAKDWLDGHEWVSDIEKLKELIDNHGGMVAVAGITSNQNEYLPLFDKIFLLQCGDETLIGRLRARTGKDEYGKTAAEREMLLSSRREFEKDLIDRGAIPVNTDSSVEEAANKIILNVDLSH